MQEQNLEGAWRLLATIAYTMTEQQIVPEDAGDDAETVANFDRIPNDDMDVEEFFERVETRYVSKAKAGLGQDRKALSALNDILENGVFDDEVSGLKEVQFRNPSLQEFLCAVYLAKYATPAESAALADWMPPEFAARHTHLGVSGCSAGSKRLKHPSR